MTKNGFTNVMEEIYHDWRDPKFATHGNARNTFTGNEKYVFCNLLHTRTINICIIKGIKQKDKSLRYFVCFLESFFQKTHSL